MVDSALSVKLAACRGRKRSSEDFVVRSKMASVHVKHKEISQIYKIRWSAGLRWIRSTHIGLLIEKMAQWQIQKNQIGTVKIHKDTEIQVHICKHTYRKTIKRIGKRSQDQRQHIHGVVYPCRWREWRRRAPWRPMLQRSHACAGRSGQRLESEDGKGQKRTLASAAAAPACTLQRAM